MKDWIKKQAWAVFSYAVVLTFLMLVLMAISYLTSRVESIGIDWKYWIFNGIAMVVRLIAAIWEIFKGVSETSWRVIILLWFGYEGLKRITVRLDAIIAALNRKVDS